jgi:hypothetical protein
MQCHLCHTQIPTVSLAFFWISDLSQVRLSLPAPAWGPGHLWRGWGGWRWPIFVGAFWVSFRGLSKNPSWQRLTYVTVSFTPFLFILLRKLCGPTEELGVLMGRWHWLDLLYDVSGQVLSQGDKQWRFHLLLLSLVTITWLQWAFLPPVRISPVTTPKQALKCRRRLSHGIKWRGEEQTAVCKLQLSLNMS